jgi:DNA-binding beta-propeller fold protein YncE
VPTNLFNVGSASPTKPSSDIGSVETLIGPSQLVTSGLVDGIGTNILMQAPTGVSVSSDDSFALVADAGNRKIRKLEFSTGELTTINPTNGDDEAVSDGIYKDAFPFSPLGVCLSRDGSFALISDVENNKIRILVLSNNVMQTLAGRSNATTGDRDGVGVNATFDGPVGLSLSPDETYALVADSNNGKIRKVMLSNGAVSTVAGPLPDPDSGADDLDDFLGGGGFSDADGAGCNATFNYPTDVRISPDGTFALVADRKNSKIRHLDLSRSPVLVSTFAGPRAGEYSSGDVDKAGENATFYNPSGIAFSPDGSFCLVADMSNNKIRMIVTSTRAVSTLAGPGQGAYPSWPHYDTDGPGNDARFFYPQSVIMSSSGVFAIVADTTNNKLRRIEMSSAVVSTLAGPPEGSLSISGTHDGIGTNAKTNQPSDVCYSFDGTFALVADTNNNKIRKIEMSTGVMTTFAGAPGSDTSRGDTDGVKTSGRLNGLSGISIAPDDSYALIGDTDNHKIRKLDMSTGTLTTFAGPREGYSNFFPEFGADGTGYNATFYGPSGVSISYDGLFALVADTNNNKIRMIVISTRVVSTLAGPAPGSFSSGSADGVGEDVRFSAPRGVSISRDGLFALIADTNGNKIRMLVISSGAVTTFAGPDSGSTAAGSLDGFGNDAQFYRPHSVKLSSNGVFALVADSRNNKIRRIEMSSAYVSTLAGPVEGSSSSGDVNGRGSRVRFNDPRGITLSDDGTAALIADSRNHHIRVLAVLGT